jgi:hypothetical protein
VTALVAHQARMCTCESGGFSGGEGLAHSLRSIPSLRLRRSDYVSCRDGGI